jgi:hypothetical protein
MNRTINGNLPDYYVLSEAQLERTEKSIEGTEIGVPLF